MNFLHKILALVHRAFVVILAGDRQTNMPVSIGFKSLPQVFKVFAISKKNFYRALTRVAAFDTYAGTIAFGD